jgi:hypothetical protein
MEDIELAGLMKQYADRVREQAEHSRVIRELEEAIKGEVSARGESLTLSGVKASYRKGRRTFDYEAGARGALPSDQLEDLMEKNRKDVFDWRRICADGEVPEEGIPFTEGQPSVSVELVEGANHG